MKSKKVIRWTSLLSSCIGLIALSSSFIFNVNSNNAKNKSIYKDNNVSENNKKLFNCKNNLPSNDETIEASKFITSDSGSVEGTINYMQDPDDENTVDIIGQDGVIATNPTFLGNVTVPITGNDKNFDKVKIWQDSFTSSEEITGKITFNDGIKEIQGSAFQNCTKLTSISLPKSLSSIGQYAFMQCPITNIDVSDENSTYHKVSVGTDTKQGYVIINNTEWDYQTPPIGCLAYGDIDMLGFNKPSDIKITEYLFDGCGGLTSVDLSKCTFLETIGESAFSKCTGLTSIIYPDNLVTIEQYAFGDCSGLISIDLSQCTSLTTIGDYVFDWCTRLTSINLPDSTTTIGQSAFEDCSGLTTISWPLNLTTIGQNAFRRCNALISIDLSKCTSLETVGSYAFNGCLGLTSIYLSNSIKFLNELSFTTNQFNETLLDSKIDIYLNWNESDFNEFDFNNTLVWPVVYDNPTSPTKMFFPSKSTFYVPKGLRSIYLANKEKLGWDLSVEGFPYTVNDTQIKEYDPDNPGGKTTNLPLILGLSLGLGVPVVAGATAGTILGIKKYNSKLNKKKK